MANIDRPNGATVFGEPIRINNYVAGGAVYPDDLVTMDSSGRVVVAAANQPLLGAARSGATAAGQEISVADHPDQQFSIQASGSEIDAQTDFGQNADLLATAGNSTYRISLHELDSSTLASTSTLQFRVLKADPAVDNSLGANARVIVRINRHQLAHNGAGV